MTEPTVPTEPAEPAGPDDRLPAAHDDDELSGTPVGRRMVLGLVALGAAGVLTGGAVQNGLARILAPIETRDPTGLVSLIPLGDTFRFYSVTGSVPTRTAADYRLAVSGLVDRPAAYSLADLRSMPQTRTVRDFQCVTGWRVPQVHWGGVRLSHLLDAAGVSPHATAVRFHSFDGTYTESLTLDQARRGDVIVALRMGDGAITHDHGGPVRMYVGPMYGYKSTKWLSRIEATARVEPGYWERLGYDVDGWVGASNGRDDDPV
ncbi:MAG TPA: molybdopterin-dependent oxidoreductase [Mycobacteriales bacterium]|nr:molybdopterin-dependent oxidoreductase [Mycobacteriales bacterium]